MTRKYSSISIETTLGIALSDTATNMSVTAGTGTALLGGVTLAADNTDQFTVAIDPDTNIEEIVLITSVSGDSFTIVRGYAGTSSNAHGVGAKVKHILSGDDLTYFNATLPGTLITAKGSLVAGTSYGVAQEVPVGPDGTTLGADSSSGTGLAWIPLVTGPTGGIGPTGPTGPTGPIGPTGPSDGPTGPTGASGSAAFTISSKSSDYTLVLNDAATNIEMNSSSSNNLTIPPNSSVAFPIGTQILISQIGSGQTTINPGSGVTLQSNGNKLKLNGQYAQASIVKRDTNTWIVSGNLIQ